MEEDEEGIVIKGAKKGDDGGVSGGQKSRVKATRMKQMATLTDEDHPSTSCHSVTLAGNREVCSVCVSTEVCLASSGPRQRLSCKET